MHCSKQMKLISPFLVALIMCGPANAENLCAVNTEVEEYLRIQESFFTKENSENALNNLQLIVANPDAKYEWITVPNNLKIIEGYVLRRDAIRFQDQEPGIALAEFCTFMEKQAWWYD